MKGEGLEGKGLEVEGRKGDRLMVCRVRGLKGWRGRGVTYNI